MLLTSHWSWCLSCEIQAVTKTGFLNIDILSCWYYFSRFFATSFTVLSPLVLLIPTMNPCMFMWKTPTLFLYTFNLENWLNGIRWSMLTSTGEGFSVTILYKPVSTCVIKILSWSRYYHAARVIFDISKRVGYCNSSIMDCCHLSGCMAMPVQVCDTTMVVSDGYEKQFPRQVDSVWIVGTTMPLNKVRLACGSFVLRLRTWG